MNAIVTATEDALTTDEKAELKSKFVFKKN